MLMTGTTIGPYRIEREIGRGGMGVIFLAQDTRLGRAAAIKALPEEVASDPERLSRFEREAKALASLTHPNVAAIYGLEESEGRRYLALEYVEGESLAERLGRGPLGVQDAVEIGVQIAAGIEAAHEAGIIHRDLKPGNVVITASDVAKVLDFGLAKGGLADSTAGAQSPTSPHSPTIANSPTLAHSPTLQTPATLPGVILGTAAYLSPEQARGKVVDRRTDIWSFGCLLYECLTGKQTFQGETVSDTIAKILERDVDWTQLPAATPPALRALLARCLEKDARRRLRDIGDARLTLEELKAGRSTAALAAVGAAQAADSDVIDSGAVKAAIAKGRRGRLLVALVAFAVGVVATVAVGRFFTPGTMRGAGPARLSLTVPADLRYRGLDVTPDGGTLVLRAEPRAVKEGEGPIPSLFMRRIDGAKFEPIPGTEYTYGVSLYPDGKRICFLQRVSERSRQNRLMKVPLDGSAPAAPLVLWDDSWGSRPVILESGDMLVTVTPGDSYVRIPAAGGAPKAPVKFNLEGSESGTYLSEALPGDRGVLLVTTSYVGNVYQQAVGVLDLKTGTSKTLVKDAGFPHYSATGHLLFTREDAIFAVPFDMGKLEVTGQPTAILNGLRIQNAWNNASFGLTRSGLAYFPSGGFVGRDRHLVMVDSQGRQEDWSGERLPFEVGAWASPDGQRALSIVATAGGLYELWLSERGRTTARRFISVPAADVFMPVWSPDASKIAYTQEERSEKDGIYVVPVDRSSPPRRVAKVSPEDRFFGTCWTRDGSRLLLSRVQRGTITAWSVPTASAGDAPPEPTNLFSRATGMRGNPTLSPDNGLIAYGSDESGRFQWYVQGWNGSAPVGESIPLGVLDSQFAVWSRDGRSLYMFDQVGRLMESVITRAPRLSAAPPRALWNANDLHLAVQFCSMLPDGRILMIRKGDAEEDVRDLDVVLDFPALVAERLRSAGSR